MLKYCRKHKKKLSNCLIIILQLYLRLNLKQNMEKDSKYQQMLQRLPLALAQVKAGNTSENLLNKIHQIIYYMYQVKEITKKVYNNIMNSIKL